MLYFFNIVKSMDIRININENDFADFLAKNWFVILICIMITLFVLYMVFLSIKNSDNDKPLQIEKATVIEKILSQGDIEWYILEFDNGKRKKLRNLNANRLIIAVGDKGHFHYRGDTIYDFVRD